MGDGGVVSGSVDSGCHKKMYGLYGLKHHIVEIRGDVTMRYGRVRKSKNFPDSKIFVAKTFRIKRVNRVNFQIHDKCA